MPIKYIKENGSEIIITDGKHHHTNLELCPNKGIDILLMKTNFENIESDCFSLSNCKNKVVDFSGGISRPKTLKDNYAWHIEPFSYGKIKIKIPGLLKISFYLLNLSNLKTVIKLDGKDFLCIEPGDSQKIEFFEDDFEEDEIEITIHNLDVPSLSEITNESCVIIENFTGCAG